MVLQPHIINLKRPCVCPNHAKCNKSHDRKEQLWRKRILLSQHKKQHIKTNVDNSMPPATGINNFTGFKPAFRITNADETSTIISNADISKPILSSFTAAKISKPMPATTSIIRQTDTKKRFIMPSLNLYIT